MSNGIPSVGVVLSDTPSEGRRQVLALAGELYDLEKLCVGRGWVDDERTPLDGLVARGVFDVSTLDSLVAEGGKASLFQEALSGLRSPVARPGKVLALGRSFPAHAIEGGNPVVGEPLLFTKLPENLIAPSDGVVLTPTDDDRFDNEIELAAYFGHGVSGGCEQEVMAAVAGFTILNDITWRNRQAALKAEGHPWFLAKNLPGATPLGPWLVPADAMGPLDSLKMECRVNGEQMLNVTTSGLMWPIPQLLSWVSRQLPIHAGDIVSLGTPKGLSSLMPGDEVVGRIDGLGEQRFTVRGRSE